MTWEDCDQRREPAGGFSAHQQKFISVLTRYMRYSSQSLTGVPRSFECVVCLAFNCGVRLAGGDKRGMTAVAEWRINERRNDERKSVPPAGLSGLQEEGEGGEERVRLGQPFCWSPKQINQGPLEHTNWITQMRQGGGHTWQSCYKAATGVGRPQLQALSEINHPCCPLPAFLLSPSLFLVLSAVLSIPLSLSPPHISFKHCNSHKAVPLFSSSSLCHISEFLILFITVWNMNILNGCSRYHCIFE